MTTKVEIKGSAAQQKAVISFMQFRKIPYVALGGEVDTKPKCHCGRVLKPFDAEKMICPLAHFTPINGTSTEEMPLQCYDPKEPNYIAPEDLPL